MNHTHPFRERRELTVEQQLQELREQTARLADFVWWRVKLTEAEREAFRRQGFPDLTLEL
jgi:hypothetical protein